MDSTTTALAPVPDPRRPLRHGRWTFRLFGDEISEVALDGVELLDSARPALRDQNWGTVAPRIVTDSWADPEQAVPDASGLLERTLELAYDGPTGRAEGSCVLRVTPSELRLTLTLTALEEVTTNRAGLTAMLPRTLAGEDLLVTTVDGHRRDLRLPAQISPWQPQFAIRALDLEHQGVHARLELTGDEFEMEDQRNWTDASFKIYSRPLERPFPYRLPAGTAVVQELILTAGEEAPASADAPADVRDRVAQGASARAAAEGSAPVATDLTALLAQALEVPLPGIGVGATTAYGAALAAPLPALAGLDHLVVEISERFPLEPILAAACAEAAAEELPVDLRIVGSPEVDLATVLDRAEEAGLVVVRAAAFDETSHVTTPELWERLVEAARSRGIEPVAGARTHFTELNRQIRRVPEAELLTVPSTPQMHHRESWHVARSLAALGDVLASARSLRPGSRLLLGPVTLRPRVYAVATEAELVDRADEHGYGAHLTPDATDPRQTTAWAGAWAAGVFAEAAAAGAESVSLMEMAGPRGIVEEGLALTPAGEVIARLAPLRGRSVRVLRGPGGPGTAVLALEGLTVLANAGLEDWHLRGADGEEIVVAAGSVELRG